MATALVLKFKKSLVAASRHVSQLFIDAFIAGKWAATSAKSLDAAAAAAKASAGALSEAELGKN